MPKQFAVVSTCFGNYRNELKNGIDKNLTFDPRADYFFLTDQDVASDHWTIIQRGPPPDKPEHMTNERWNAKLAKWEFAVLKEYPIVVWMDSKLILWPSVSVDCGKVAKMVNDSPCAMLWNCKHWREHPAQELDLTVRGKKENEPRPEFRERLTKTSFDIPLVDTCCMIFRPKYVERAFAEVLRLLRTEKLLRDQNVFNLALKNCGIDARRHETFLMEELAPSRSHFGRFLGGLKAKLRRHGVGGRWKTVHRNTMALYMRFGATFPFQPWQ